MMMMKYVRKFARREGKMARSTTKNPLIERLLERSNRSKVVETRSL